MRDHSRIGTLPRDAADVYGVEQRAFGAVDSKHAVAAPDNLAHREVDAGLSGQHRVTRGEGEHQQHDSNRGRAPPTARGAVVAGRGADVVHGLGRARDARS